MNGTYNVDKLNELEKNIQERLDLLDRCINIALGNNSLADVTSLKQQKLQCEAELRLIKHIKTGMNGEFFIC